MTAACLSAVFFDAGGTNQNRWTALSSILGVGDAQFKGKDFVSKVREMISLGTTVATISETDTCLHEMGFLTNIKVLAVEQL